METVRFCKECGATMPADAPEGLCPKCLVQAGLASSIASAASSPEEKTVGA